jgi:uncharacterized protein YfaS (alpha-2-macroglobulin family)
MVDQASIMKRFHTARILFVLLGLVITGCGPENGSRQELPAYSLETARWISHVPDDVLHGDGEIHVRFVNAVVSEERIGTEPDEALFRFDPPVRGNARWTDSRTLSFQPERPMERGRTVSGQLKLDRIIPEAPPLLEFQFSVAGREMEKMDVRLSPLAPQGDRMQLTGSLAFTQEAHREKVESGVRLLVDGESVPLSWEGRGTDRSFTCRSGEIVRTGESRTGVLVIDKDHLALSSDVKREFIIPAAGQMKVVEIEKREAGESVTLVVRFSEEPDPMQDLTGLLEVQPQVSLSLKAVGNEVYLQGAFRHGTTYTLSVYPGIRSRAGNTLGALYRKEVTINDIKPRIRFARDGVFLPSANQQKIRFQTVNLRKVRCRIQKVFESNLAQFLQVEHLGSSRDRRDYFSSWEVKRVGVDVASDTLLIGEERNTWRQHELDLHRIVPGGEKGCFLVTLSFDEEDMLYGRLGQETEEERLQRRRQYYYGRDYYNDPYSPGYRYRWSRVEKAVIFSDIGLMVKKAHQRVLVLATRFQDAAPWKDVSITLRTYQNQMIARMNTDDEGRADFTGIREELFLVEAEKDGQRSVIKPNEMAWNLSGFDTKGRVADPDAVHAYVYTERGVYRPGDPINLSLIVRNQTGTFPDDHPVELVWVNPRNQTVLRRLENRARDGFYNFAVSTRASDPTGIWHARFQVGPRVISHPVRVETVVPFRLKVRLEPEKPALAPEDTSLLVDLSANYLFGNPAGGLAARVDARVESRVKTFNRFPDYVFSHEGLEPPSLDTPLFSGNLDDQGRMRVLWKLPRMEGVPSGLHVLLTAEVLEKGGRPNRGYAELSWTPYQRFVGIRKPGVLYMQVGTPVNLPVVCVNDHGEPVAGRSLTFQIFRNDTHWWWEYDNRHTFRMRFKQDRHTRLIRQGNLETRGEPVRFDFTPEDDGEYLIEVRDTSGGHTAAVFINAYAWGQMPAAGDEADRLLLKADKPEYRPGDTARITFPSPREGRMLVSVEKGAGILQARWVEPDSENRQMTLDIPVTKEMIPNAYVSIAVIQPHQQTVNDRPMRVYGILPLNVVDPATRLGVAVKAPEKLKPGHSFQVEIQMEDKREAQFTLAVVDEGLLDLTRFSTPDPWKAFFSKEQLGVLTYDLFSHVIGAHKGDVFRTFSIGGGVEEAYRASQMAPEKSRRFRPVCLFKGPLETDKKGRAKVDFQMPNYMGSVRIMAVAARGNQYGSAEKAVPVTQDLIVMPTLPRFLGPGDRFSLPVTVFALGENQGPVEVRLETEGPVRVTGASRQTVDFSEKGEKDILFQCQVLQEVGTARFTIQAASGQNSAREETEVEVRASSPRIYESVRRTCRPGESISLVMPGEGLPGSAEAQIRIQRRPDLNFSHRLYWLMRFPYGCIEQTVSAVFPQLYLKKIMETDLLDASDLDRNINAGIARLRRFQLPSGAFAYWPGNTETSVWGTLYAGHFLIEAKNRGYHVPSDLMDNWFRYTQSQALTSRDNLMMRTYRVYLLAAGEQPQIGAMNLLKENNLKDMNDTQKWLLAGAYQLAGVPSTAMEIRNQAGMAVEDYFEFGHTYGSGIRDKAIILEMLVLFEDWTRAREVAEELAGYLETDSWYSTQTLGTMLLATGKFLEAVEGGEKPLLKGEFRLPDGKRRPFETREIGISAEISGEFQKKKVEVVLDARSEVNQAFVTLDWSGVPVEGIVGDLARNLQMEVEWIDEEGLALDPSRMVQGQVFWLHIRARKSQDYTHPIDEAALVQLLPAGWEVENIRLSGEDLPYWMNSWALHREEYLDIRDDRILWFFDFPEGSGSLDFVVKLHAVTAGRFTLPATVLEAMYNTRYQARKAGYHVSVLPRE